MEYVQGRIFWNVQLPELEAEERRAVYEELARVLAAIHSVDLGAVGLSDYGRPDAYVARQVKRWTKQYLASQTADIEQMNTLIEWLPAKIPDDEATALVHGDYRLDNLIFHPTERAPSRSSTGSFRRWGTRFRTWRTRACFTM